MSNIQGKVVLITGASSGIGAGRAGYRDRAGVRRLSIESPELARLILEKTCRRIVAGQPGSRAATTP
ncbi:hypothetical protein A9K81_09645 [Pseudomonas syringae pv. syringae]|nr:hypothetical protein [Pseudomonas syringae]OBS35058.1 hypothetical protein A9K81_09645 [Pseudomonas syringae pv. syringae]